MEEERFPAEELLTVGSCHKKGESFSSERWPLVVVHTLVASPTGSAYELHCLDSVHHKIFFKRGLKAGRIIY